MKKRNRRCRAAPVPWPGPKQLRALQPRDLIVLLLDLNVEMSRRCRSKPLARGLIRAATMIADDPVELKFRVEAAQSMLRGYQAARTSDMTPGQVLDRELRRKGVL